MEQVELADNDILSGDDFVIELSEDTALETYVIESWDDCLLLHVDGGALNLLEHCGCSFEDEEHTHKGGRIHRSKHGLIHHAGPDNYGGSEDDKDPLDKMHTSQQRWKMDRAILANDDEVDEAEYHGHKVAVGKPTRGDVKKSKVYVRKPNGKIVKVNFGDKNLSIKKHLPKHRKSFRARHHCENPGPRWKAKYWSCRAW